jgi:hypothetical protein
MTEEPELAVDESRLKPIAQGEAKIIEGALFPWLTTKELIGLTFAPILIGLVLIYFALRRSKKPRAYVMIEE